MELEKFIGTWENEAGIKLEIRPNNKTSLKVSFFNQGGSPVRREYFNNAETIDMHAELDYYESSLKVDLWKKGKGFHLCLLYDYIEFKDKESGYYLAPELSSYEKDSFLVKYFYLFEPLDYYKKVK